MVLEVQKIALEVGKVVEVKYVVMAVEKVVVEFGNLWWRRKRG